VKSKAAYNQAVVELEHKIEDGEDLEFAIVMVDLNDLKKVNDSCGHEHGDKYIIGSCNIICDIYEHSPIFRIGGDEFVIILQGQDYENRLDLYRELNRQFKDASADMQREPWERYSAAAGMAEYTRFPNETVEDIFRIADENMYEEKQKMKQQHLR
jgi:diguanylate cyclase (GGDEF)-like protein